MGTWAAGPFGNDAALDWVTDLFSTMMAPIEEFMESPQIDETFDAAFAALGVLNAVMGATPGRPWRDGAQVDPAPIRAAFMRCFDEQIDGMQPSPGFKDEQRGALIATLDAFQRHLEK